MKIYDADEVGRPFSPVAYSDASPASGASGRNALWRFLGVWHLLVTVASVPVALFLAIFALMAESGGKRSHPLVVPFLVWGVAELAWTQLSILRTPGVGLSSRLSERIALTIGLAITLLVSPGVLVTVMLADGSEWSLAAPYLLVTAGCQITRYALAEIES